MAKRRVHSDSSASPSSATDFDEEVYDLEKHLSSDESDSTTSITYSERSDSHILLPCRTPSHEPILRDPSFARRRNRRSRYHSPLIGRRWCQCTPRKFSRYFTLALLSTIILFIITLTKLSWASSRSVTLGYGKTPPPPPPWKNFPFLKRYHGGIRTLVSRQDNVPEFPTREDDAPRFAKEEMKFEPRGEPQKEQKPIPPSIKFHPYGSNPSAKQTCWLDKDKKIRIPDVRAYDGVPAGMPDNIMGSYDMLNLRNDVCFDRFGRLGPYGLGYSKKNGGSGAGIDGDREGAEEIWGKSAPIDYRTVQWGAAQKQCLDDNKHRFVQPPKRPGTALYQEHEAAASEHSPSTDKTSNATTTAANDNSQSTLLKKTAILIRTWSNYEYDDEDLFYLRSLIWELAFQTGGEYTVHFLIHVKNNRLPIWADENLYQQVLEESLPAEFAGMGTLWSEHQMSMIYNNLSDTKFRGLPVHGVYRGAYMPITWFAHQHPEFEYFWNFEMDARYTGHYYHLLTKSSQWAAKQPRKGLWERNARFYIPAEHGTWEDFSQMVRVQTEHGTAGKSNMWTNVANNPAVPDFVREEITRKPEKPVWGPEVPVFNHDLDNSTDVYPPHSMAQDKYEWGVNEEADLITFNPIFDPQGTSWLLSEDITGYNTTAGLPRRASIINFTRLSQRLLQRMHGDMAFSQRSLFSEMWPSTVALHHGFKAVYVPHPVFVDRRWPTDYLAATFNGGRNGQSGGNRASVFGDREHNFLGISWYYNSGFAPNLWKRWLGYKVDNDGGEANEVDGEGRMCLPAMLLHPVKQVDLVYEENGTEENG